MTSNEWVELQDFCNYYEQRIRTYKLRRHDRVYISRDAYKIKLGEYIPDTSLMCVELVKRDKWWQFWKPRYKGAIYEVMEDM